jgi:hypothetical protein
VVIVIDDEHRRGDAADRAAAVLLGDPLLEGLPGDPVVVEPLAIRRVRPSSLSSGCGVSAIATDGTLWLEALEGAELTA